MKKTKILFCSNTFAHSNHGPAKFARFVLQINFIEDYEIRILTESVDSRFQPVHFVELFWAKVFKPFSMIFRMFDYYRAGRKLKKEYDFDIMVFNHSFIGLWSKLMFRDKVLVVGMINDENSLSFKCSDLKFTWYSIRHYIFRWFEAKAAHSLDFIIANSKYIRNLIIREYGIQSNKVGLVYKGVDLMKFPKFSMRLIDVNKEINVLFVKSDATVGGLKYLCSALTEMKEYQFCLTLVGNHQDYEFLTNSVGLKIKQLGLLDENRLFEVMKNEADIFCVPSLKEGLGVANMEAALHSLPIISTKVGGIPEVLDDGISAILVEAKNVEALKTGFRFLLSDLNQTNTRRLKAYNKVKSQFDINNTLLSFLECIEAAKYTHSES